LKASNYDVKTKRFYLYVQWVAREQMEQLIESFRAKELRFYLDLPLGVDGDSFDSWAFRNFFAKGVSAGAPPDSFFTKGQNWGFAPLHPEETRRLHYHYVIEYLRFQMRHTDMLRIDHVMGLHRLYWIPDGCQASDGAYVSYPAEELYAILSVESHRHQCRLVGENLGTVPPEVNAGMKRHGLRGMYVLQYEQRPRGAMPKPARASVSSLNTHDMPTFAAYWAGKDIEDRADLGLTPPRDVARQKRERAAMGRNLVRFLRGRRLLSNRKPSPEQVLIAVLKFLGESDSETVLVSLEDLWLEERSQNTPGTTIERVNWRWKARLGIEELTRFVASRPELLGILKQLADRGERPRRRQSRTRTV
jgi:4-alpha-glucanotransferase